MKIEIIRKEGAHNVWTILINDELWRDIHTTIFGRRPAIPELSSSLADFTTQFEVLEYKKALNYALRRLAMKNQPSTELRKKLSQCLISDPIIERIISECQRLGYLNDVSWLEAYIRSLQNRNMGPQMILYKLYQKGISQEIARQAMSQFYAKDAPQGTIERLLESKFKNPDLSDCSIKRKVVSFLVRKGFAWEDIKNSINNLD